MVVTLVFALSFAQIIPDGPPPPTGLTSETIEVPAEGDEVNFIVDSIRWIRDKFKNKEYGPAIAAILMLILTIANLLVIRLGKEIRKEWMPTVAMATGVGVALATQLFDLKPTADWFEWVLAISQGAVVGLAATGVWELIGKKIFKTFLEKEKVKVAEKKAAKETPSA